MKLIGVKAMSDDWGDWQIEHEQLPRRFTDNQKVLMELLQILEKESPHIDKSEKSDWVSEIIIKYRSGLHADKIRPESAGVDELGNVEASEDVAGEEEAEQEATEEEAEQEAGEEEAEQEAGEEEEVAVGSWKDSIFVLLSDQEEEEEEDEEEEEHLIQITTTTDYESIYNESNQEGKSFIEWACDMFEEKMQLELEFNRVPGFVFHDEPSKEIYQWLLENRITNGTEEDYVMQRLAENHHSLKEDQVVQILSYAIVACFESIRHDKSCTVRDVWAYVDDEALVWEEDTFEGLDDIDVPVSSIWDSLDAENVEQLRSYVAVTILTQAIDNFLAGIGDDLESNDKLIENAYIGAINILEELEILPEAKAKICREKGIEMHINPE